jgi:hypothetical protein
MQAKTRVVCPVSVSKIAWQTGVAMWSPLLALALLLLPAQALAGAKEKIAALAPSGLVLVTDAQGNELVAQNADEPFVPASVTKIVTGWMAMEVLGGDYASRRAFTWTTSAVHTRGRRSLPDLRRAGSACAPACDIRSPFDRECRPRRTAIGRWSDRCEPDGGEAQGSFGNPPARRYADRNHSAREQSSGCMDLDGAH